MRSLWSKYYKDAHGIVFIIDSTDEERIKEARDELSMSLSLPSIPILSLSIEKIFMSEDLKDLPILICANKQDLVVFLLSLSVHSFCRTSSTPTPSILC